MDSMSLFISRSDFLTGHGIRPVSDVNENFSTPVNIYTEQNGFREDSEQPASTQNTVIPTFFIKGLCKTLAIVLLTGWSYSEISYDLAFEFGTL